MAETRASASRRSRCADVALRRGQKLHSQSRPSLESETRARGPLSDLTEAVTSSADEGGAEVRKLVLDLPDRYRELVMLVHWDGFSIAEAAQMLGLGQSTARTRYARARDRLRAQVELL